MCYTAFNRWKPIVGLPVDSWERFKNLTAPVWRGGFMTSGDQKIAKIQTHFKTLSEIASTLNTASDELTGSICVLDEALKKLNVGLTAWVTFRDRTVDEWRYDVDQIGYCKIDSKWGIALRRIWGDQDGGEFNETGPWPFNDGPRDMRIAAADKIPELIEALGKTAFDTTKKVQETAREVSALASAIEKIANGPGRTGPSKKGSKRTAVSLSSEQLKRILTGVQERQKFLGEVLEHASRWELESGDLWIYFPAVKRPFAEMLEGRESISKVSDVAKEILGYPVQVIVKLEPPVTNASTAGNDKGGN
jgi:hypothetical protein